MGVLNGFRNNVAIDLEHTARYFEEKLNDLTARVDAIVNLTHTHMDVEVRSHAPPTPSEQISDLEPPPSGKDCTPDVRGRGAEPPRVSEVALQRLGFSDDQIDTLAAFLLGAGVRLVRDEPSFIGGEV